MHPALVDDETSYKQSCTAPQTDATVVRHENSTCGAHILGVISIWTETLPRLVNLVREVAACVHAGTKHHLRR
jgi:hypothetical protein